MSADRILYRTRQFWQALGATLTSEDLDLVRAVLTPPQLALFERLQPNEQAHSLRVLRSLLDQGEDHPDLLVAALLHDVGKSRFPLNIWQRVLIVLVNAVFPHFAPRLGSASGGAWRRPFILAEKHAQWGAEMAYAAGASPLAVALIKRHQEELSADPERHLSLETRLLLKLQSVDDNS